MYQCQPELRLWQTQRAHWSPQGLSALWKWPSNIQDRQIDKLFSAIMTIFCLIKALFADSRVTIKPCWGYFVLCNISTSVLIRHIVSNSNTKTKRHIQLQKPSLGCRPKLDDTLCAMIQYRKLTHIFVTNQWNQALIQLRTAFSYYSIHKLWTQYCSMSYIATYMYYLYVLPICIIYMYYPQYNCISNISSLDPKPNLCAHPLPRWKIRSDTFNGKNGA